MTDGLQPARFQIPLFRGFSRPEDWSGLPFPTLGDISNSRIKSYLYLSPAWDSLSLSHLGTLLISIYSHLLRLKKKILILIVCLNWCHFTAVWGFSGGTDGKQSSSNAGDPRSIPESGRSSGEGNGSPLQYSCLENSMDRGTLWASVHDVTKSQTWLGVYTTTTAQQCLLRVVLGSWQKFRSIEISHKLPTPPPTHTVQSLLQYQHLTLK